VSAAATTGVRPARRGTTGQRVRAGLLRALAAVLARLPFGVVDALADVAGALWYRAAPGRAAVARGNLAHVVDQLAARGEGPTRVRAAARDADALERLVRGVFRHACRAYAETLRGPIADRDIARRLVIETPAAVDAAFGTPGPAVYATLHFGSMTGMAAIVAERSPVPVTGPMETLADPELQRLILELRSRPRARIVDLADARRALRAALARGEVVGVVGDRPISGGGVPTPLFGLPALLPIGPAYLALDAAAPLHVGAIRRVGSTYRGRLVTLPHEPSALPLRSRIESLLAVEATVFEQLVAVAPDQWWAVFYPIWEAVGPLSREAARERARAGAAA
jgi:KDO2-lipid IV(A) lauroyltransferase